MVIGGINNTLDTDLLIDAGAQHVFSLLLFIVFRRKGDAAEDPN